MITPSAVARTLIVPTFHPRRREVCALPSASVVTVLSVSSPSLSLIEKETFVPRLGLLLASLYSTIKGDESVLPTKPTCLSPEIK